MQDLSYADAAHKYTLPEKLIESLCAENKLEGAYDLCGFWFFPETEKNLALLKQLSEKQTDDLLSLKDFCNELSVSTATGKNWVRLGKIEASSKDDKGNLLFSRDYLESTKLKLKAGELSSLKSRRNKKYVTGNEMYGNYAARSEHNRRIIRKLISKLSEQGVMVSNLLTRPLLAECALQLLYKSSDKKAPFENAAGNPEYAGIIFEYLDGKIEDNRLFLIEELLNNTKKKQTLRTELEAYRALGLFSIEYEYVRNEDLLGLLYMSIKGLGDRKALGAYYTPEAVVKKICSGLFGSEKNKATSDYSDKLILDPCCGTGNFLLQLPDSVKVENIRGYDIDELSVAIARINISLKFNLSSALVLTKTIAEYDFLGEEESKVKADYIIGNPPWGYDFSDAELLDLTRRYKSAHNGKLESYDAFVEHSLDSLKTGGILSFVLPEAILNVKSHRNIRALMMQKSRIQSVEFLGNVFDKVQCPSIIARIEYTGSAMSVKGLEVIRGEERFVVRREREISPDSFDFFVDDRCFRILDKLSDSKTLTTVGSKVDFALGIVTGNNSLYISHSPKKGYEPILKGSDLHRYNHDEASNFIRYEPDSFQQVAAEFYYRAKEKLLYRFIGQNLVFAYDGKGTLSLNSCNVLLSNSKDYKLKYLLAVLNSSVAQYYFTNRFHSFKVLKSYIEQIPVPVLSLKEQKNIIAQVDKLLECTDEKKSVSLYESLDKQLAALYGLTPDEYEFIKQKPEDYQLFKTTRRTRRKASEK